MEEFLPLWLQEFSLRGLASYRQLHAERGPVEQVDPALDDVPGAVDGLVRRRRPSAASQPEVSESKIES